MEDFRLEDVRASWCLDVEDSAGNRGHIRTLRWKREQASLLKALL
jgi:hypothetical protein